ncbi:MAG: hypothetical protein MUF05_02495 [Candidatus Omnitrophica bacterium]|nr:hypothetical protein [Candidatus Omnitrophota bacterium]
MHRINKIYDSLKKWIFSHPWLKLLALGIAIALWFYVRDEINRFNY